MQNFEQIKKLITETLLPTNESDIVQQAPHDYHSLTDAVMLAELQEELTLLNTVFENKSLEECKTAFVELCHNRALRNAGTCLSFSAMPYGTCNNLYWKITKLLFQPKTLDEMLVILEPQVQTLLTCELSGNLHNIQLGLKQNTLKSLQKPPSRKMLSHFVIIDSFIFDARDIENFPFEMHQAFYLL